MADYSLSQLTEDLTAADTDLVEVSKDNGDGTYSSRKQTRSTLLTGKADQADLDAHEADTDNPHSVTKAQVGLSNVDNTSDAAKPVSTATQTVLNTKAAAVDLTAHTNNTANPHTTTKAQVGLANVDNTADLAKPISTATQSALDNKSAVGHGHTSSDVSDFTEAVQDAVAALLAAGTAISLSYDDVANSLTINSTGGDGGGLDAEAVRDAIGVALLGTGLITVTVNDAADTITISTTATANDTDANLKNRANHTGSQAISTVTGLQTTLDSKANAADLGTAATADTGDFATAAQGTKADTAVQPAAIADFETTIELNARDTANRDRANHTGTQVASTISDFDTEVSSNTDVAANTAGRHSHANKALLDTYDQTNANLADAVTKKHAHSNSAVLDATTASFTTDDENKLDGIEPGAQANVSEINDVATTTTNTWSADKISTEIAAGGGGGTTLPDQTGHSGEFLTTDGSALSWDTPAGGGGGSSTPRGINYYEAVDGSAWNISLINGATATIANGVIPLVTGTTSGGRAYVRHRFANAHATKAVNMKNPHGVATFNITQSPTNGNAYFRFFSSSDANVNTAQQMGFRGHMTSGTRSFYATNGNGTTETATNMIASVTDPYTIQLFSAIMTDSVDIKFYSAGTLRATHTTNLPGTGATDFRSNECAMWVDNNSTTESFTLNFYRASLTYEIY